MPPSTTHHFACAPRSCIVPLVLSWLLVSDLCDFNMTLTLNRKVIDIFLYCSAWMSAGCAGFWYTGNFDAMLEYVNNFQFGSTVLYGAKFLLAYPLVYHYTNGMRHLVSCWC